MTLVITVLTKDRVVQVADTRLVFPNGREYKADAIKSVCVSCEDAYFTIGYSGIAEIKDQPLDEWLKDEVTKLMKSEFYGAKQITDNLVKSLDTEFASLTYKGRPVGRQYKGLLLALAGFQHELDGQGGFTLPFLVTVSNVERWRLGEPIEVADKFRCEAYTLRSALPDFEPKRQEDEPVCVVNGERLALFAHDRHAKETKEMLNSTRRWLQRIDQEPRSDAKTSTVRLAEVIQRASTHPKYGKYVGPNCISVVMNSNLGGIFSHYHPLEATVEKRTPHFIALE